MNNRLIEKLIILATEQHRLSKLQFKTVKLYEYVIPISSRRNTIIDFTVDIPDYTVQPL